MIFNMTGGGSGLNFKVKAYASELLLPATAAENTIAVITSTPISSYIFSGAEPDAPEEGMVWISTSATSTAEFSATKKNPVMVYPSAAKQYILGAWVTVTAKTYQGGTWVDWIYTLYDAGTQYVEWISKPGNGSNWTHIPAYFYDTYMYIETGSDDSDTITAGFVTKNKIDITGFSKLVVELSNAEVNELSYIVVQITTRQTDNWEHNYAIAYAEAITGGVKKIAVNFNATGSYYIDIFGMRKAEARITKVYLA